MNIVNLIEFFIEKVESEIDEDAKLKIEVVNYIFKESCRYEIEFLKGGKDNGQEGDYKGCKE